MRISWSAALASVLVASELRATPPRTVGFRESARVHIGHAPVGLAVLPDPYGYARRCVAVVNDDSTLTTLVSDGAGGLGEQRDVELGSDLAAVTIGDLDNDGLPDLAVSSPASGAVFALRGAADGSFGDVHALAGPWAPGALARMGPSRGSPDLVVADLFFQAIVLARNGGDGSFEFGGQMTGFLDPVSLAVGDVDGDGVQDVAVADAASHVSTVLTALGQSGQRRHDQALAGRPVAVALGDLDRDGHDDLVVATRSPATLVVCRGNADGSIGPARADPAGPAPVALVLGDLDGDGRLDVALADHDDRSIGIWLGRGNGALIKLGDVPTGAGPVALAIADMNRDGWPDLVCANHDEGTVQVFLNASSLPAGSIRLLPPTPNPASTTTRITFVLSTSSEAHLEIHDLTGRLVRSLLGYDSVLAPGPQSIVWDGRTNAGTLARSGVYFVHLRACGAEATTRFVLHR